MTKKSALDAVDRDEGVDRNIEGVTIMIDNNSTPDPFAEFMATALTRACARFERLPELPRWPFPGPSWAMLSSAEEVERNGQEGVVQQWLGPNLSVGQVRVHLERMDFLPLIRAEVEIGEAKLSVVIDGTEHALNVAAARRLVEALTSGICELDDATTEAQS